MVTEMPIAESEFQKPRFIRYQDRYPLAYDKFQRYTDTVVAPKNYQARSNSLDGRGNWKQPGYNPNHNSITIEKVSLTNESPQFKPN